jgi:hypothetical protein
MDYIGDEGRPLAAIEPEMLIRVEDLLGDYLMVKVRAEPYYLRPSYTRRALLTAVTTSWSRYG